MKSIKLFSFFTVLGLLLFSSCRKLTENPKSVITPDSYYQDETQVRSAYVAAMNALWTRNNGAYEDNMGYFNEDDQITRGDLNIPEDWGAELWTAHYQAMLNINTAIRTLNKGLKNVDQDAIDQLMAEGKFLRAYNYFMLVRMFGDVPLITEDTPDPVNNPLARTAIKDVYAQIIKDFTDAIAKLPATRSGDEKGLPTQDAAKGLLAKVYLTMATFPVNEPENYAKAADLAAQVMAAGNYSLVPDIKDLFSVATQYGPEMMWSFNSNAQHMGPDPHIWSDMRGYGDICAQPEWEKAYPPSPRKDAFIETELDGVNYADLGDYWPGVKKFQYDNPDDFDAGRSLVTMPVIRYADVLLIFAEAENMSKGGPDAAAISAINQVIDRGNGYVANAADPLATTALSQADFDTKVIQERNYELCFEMDRWFDLIRKHILKEKSLPEIQQNFTPDDYLFPIPLNEVRTNPMILQNPGY